jgi:hypothetical protein
MGSFLVPLGRIALRNAVCYAHAHVARRPPTPKLHLWVALRDVILAPRWMHVHALALLASIHAGANARLNASIHACSNACAPAHRVRAAAVGPTRAHACAYAHGAVSLGSRETSLCCHKQDDSHNPAVIADNVGDNVGDVAGQGFSLACFETCVRFLGPARLKGLSILGEKETNTGSFA